MKPRPHQSSPFVLATLLLAAAGGSGCSGSSDGNSDGSADRSTPSLGTDAGSGSDLGPGADTGPGGSACPARPDLVAAAPTCNNVVNSAVAVPFTAASGTAPTPAGGAIRDGLYEATRTGAYGSTTGGGRRITFVILEGATRMLWNGEVLDATGNTVTTTFRADVAISVVGTKINITPSCVSVAQSPFPPAFDYTVSNNDLVLSLATGTTVAATTYTRRGCAP
jgi:hypothetical protein